MSAPRVAGRRLQPVHLLEDVRRQAADAVEFFHRLRPSAACRGAYALGARCMDRGWLLSRAAALRRSAFSAERSALSRALLSRPTARASCSASGFLARRLAACFGAASGARLGCAACFSGSRVACRSFSSLTARRRSARVTSRGGMSWTARIGHRCLGGACAGAPSRQAAQLPGAASPWPTTARPAQPPRPAPSRRALRSAQSIRIARLTTSCKVTLIALHTVELSHEGLAERAYYATVICRQHGHEVPARRGSRPSVIATQDDHRADADSTAHQSGHGRDRRPRRRPGTSVDVEALRAQYRRA